MSIHYATSRVVEAPTDTNTYLAGIQQVPFQSRDPFTDIDGIYPNLHYIFDAYDEVTIPDVDGKPDNALWTSGRTGYPEGIAFQTYSKNMGP